LEDLSKHSSYWDRAIYDPTGQPEDQRRVLVPLQEFINQAMKKYGDYGGTIRDLEQPVQHLEMLETQPARDQFRTLVATFLKQNQDLISFIENGRAKLRTDLQQAGVPAQTVEEVLLDVNTHLDALRSGIKIGRDNRVATIASDCVNLLDQTKGKWGIKDQQFVFTDPAIAQQFSSLRTNLETWRVNSSLDPKLTTRPAAFGLTLRPSLATLRQLWGSIDQSGQSPLLPADVSFAGAVDFLVAQLPPDDQKVAVAFTAYCPVVSHRIRLFEGTVASGDSKDLSVKTKTKEEIDRVAHRLMDLTTSAVDFRSFLQEAPRRLTNLIENKGIAPQQASEKANYLLADLKLLDAAIADLVEIYSTMTKMNQLLQTHWDGWHLNEQGKIMLDNRADYENYRTLAKKAADTLERARRKREEYMRAKASSAG
jgi:hypothetical protein